MSTLTTSKSFRWAPSASRLYCSCAWGKIQRSEMLTLLESSFFFWLLFTSHTDKVFSFSCALLTTKVSKMSTTYTRVQFWNRKQEQTCYNRLSWYFMIFSDFLWFADLYHYSYHITHSPSANSWSFYPGRASAIITAARISRCSRHWSSAANPALLLMRFHLFSNPLKLLTFEWGHGLINPWHSNIRNKSQAIVQRTFCKSTPCRVIKWLNERMK